MGVFVFLPLVLPLTAWPVARLAEQRLHPRTATVLLTATACALAVCSTLCLGLVVIVGTAQIPGNPLPDGWSDDEVREAVPCDEVAGRAAIPLLLAILASCTRTLWGHARTRRRAQRALAGLSSPTVVLPDRAPYAWALPARRGRPGRVVVSRGMLAALNGGERRALFAHERAHLAGHHHRYLLAVRLAARANPFLRPLNTAVAYTVERWADEAAAQTVGSRRITARAIGKAALITTGAPSATLAGFAAAGPVPRRVAALLAPPPAPRRWPPALTAVGLSAWTAAVGTTVSALSSANSAITLFLLLRTATPF
ncbi:M56 family metallopeptidase [Streptomyces aidingensis]|uniref:Peptidase family M48 n=1 Tax=Streptomyces aidingensis TaxID=910347 RepID=A0A1I1N7R6_9ACTN|nr:M56 family metallopeptidase [Streptomyces aidingensis]SFC93657.1 Peptidase family M48 [Streptomyces aidingensis]